MRQRRHRIAPALRQRLALTRQGRQVRRLSVEPLESRRLLDATPVRLTNTNPPFSFGDFSTPIVAGDLAFFFAEEVATGRELWKTDGTPAGTSLVKDIWPGPDGAVDFIEATEVAALGDEIFFQARTSIIDNELWKSDGTVEGTVRVKDIREGTSGSNPQWLTPMGDKLFFVASTPAGGTELWKTDGTEAGTGDGQGHLARKSVELSRAVNRGERHSVFLCE
ncbi:MAG: hypothetical protein HY000_02030 [Planctomycetes bacterium]|nr:hypothetical protein [Planctomycetota bacterium]